jgi:predicted Zn finger-like uncharacterized protein
MKITCQACQAKYTIADEKVLGKVVKIRCKKCGATIVVNGNDPTAVTTSSAPPEAPSGSEGDAAEGWTVNVAEGDQRTMSNDELVAAYRAGTVDDETYCWKDGMDDWLPIREIAALYDACKGGGESRPASAQQSGGSGRTAAAANGSGANPAPVAARRAGGRAPSADLFGGAAQAGGEDDVMTSAPAKMPQAHEDAKLIGARNENSVLFSLNTLTGKSDRPPPPPDSEASGLIDIRQLSAQLGSGEETKKKGSRVDDIMNLSSGGAFSPTLTAPALAAPPIESYAAVAEKASLAPSSKGRGLLVLAGLGGVAFVALAVTAAMTLMRGKGDETAEKERPAASASAAGIAAPSEPTAAASASAAPEEAPGAASAASAASAPKEAPSAAPSATVAAAAPVQHAAPAAAPAARPAPAAAAESDQPFNMGEAKARLAAVAGAVQSCKKAGGPTGTGRVVVVFAPSGAAQSASVTGDPFEGTPTGGCVANHFRAVRVPAFAGGAFSVAKSFTIN